jgi:preprotein translocase subunit SecY
MEPGLWFRIETAITLCAGTAFIMWLGEQITERGIGNGISLIIMAGIVARMPTTMLQTLDLAASQEIDPLSTFALFVFGIATIAVIVYFERSQRRIPVQYPKRAMGRRMTQAQTQHLPLKVNTAGVLPPIFASVFLAFPLTIAQLAKIEQLEDFLAWFNPSTWFYNAVFGGLIIFFCYFYTALVFDPNQVAENLKRNGGFVPTVRPGRDTADFLNRVLTRLTLWGSIYICAVCIAPQIFYSRMGAASFSYFFGGTAVLIVVGVTLDTLSQIESHVVARNYQGFMSKSPGKMRGGVGRASQMRGKLIQR